MSSQYDELLHFAADFWQWRAIHQPITSDDLLRIERPMDWQSGWPAAAVSRQREQLSVLEGRWQPLDSSVWPVSQQMDYRLMGSGLRVCAGNIRGRRIKSGE